MSISFLLASLATLLITVGISESDAWDHKSGMLVCHFTRVKAEDPSVGSKALTTMDLHCACLSGSHAHFWLLTGLPYTLAPHYLRCSAFPPRGPCSLLSKACPVSTKGAPWPCPLSTVGAPLLSKLSPSCELGLLFLLSKFPAPSNVTDHLFCVISCFSYWNQRQWLLCSVVVDPSMLGNT